MFCGKCGRQVNKKDRVCAFCGTPILKREYKYKNSVILGSVLLCLALVVLGALLFFKFQPVKLQWGMAQTEADAVFKEQVNVYESTMVSDRESVYRSDLQFENIVFEDAQTTMHFEPGKELYMMEIQFYHDTETVINALSKKFGTITEEIDSTVSAVEWKNEKIGVIYNVDENFVTIYNPSVYTPPVNE